MNSKHVGNVITGIALLILLTGSVSADVVQVGSSIDATITSFTTHLDAKIAGADSPAVINYEVSAKGITQPDGTIVPMRGSAVAYIRAHITGGHDSNGGGIRQDLTYSDITKVSGLINSFQKSIAYKGGSYLA
jgi:ribosomal protein S6E (S10)